MALNFRKFLDGIRVIPKTTSTANEKGELDVTDSTGKLNYHNGTSSSPVVTEAHSATLTNKTLDSPVIIGTPSIQIPIVIDVNSASDALRITQTGAGAALRVEDSTNPDATPFVIDASGNVGIGTASPAARLEVENGTGVRTSYNANADDLAIDGPANTGITISSANNAIGSILFADNDSDLRGAVQYTHTTNALYLSTDGSERLRIDSLGRVLVGSTSARNIGTSLVSSSIQVEGTNTNNSSILAYGNTNTSTGSGILVLGKSRGTAVGSVTAVQSGDSLGRIHFMGADGTSGGVTGAFIIGQVDGTVATNVMPGALTFWTTPASSNTPLERLRIDSLGKVGIGKAPSGAAGCVLDLGGSTTTEIRLRTTTTGTTNSDGLAIQMWDDNNVYLVNYEPASMVFGTSGTERLRIDSSGNVGINTVATSPQKPLHIIASGTANRFPLRIQNSESAASADTGIELLTYNGTSVTSQGYIQSTNSAWTFGVYGANSTSLIGAGNGGTNVVAANASGIIKFATGGDAVSNERMRIDSSGNVGIGVTTPQARLHLANSTSLNAIFDYYSSVASPDASLIFRGARGTGASPTALLSGDSLGILGGRGYGATAFSASSRAVIQFLAAENWTDAAQGTNIAFLTTPTSSTTREERLRITSAGNVGIGVTSPSSSLHIAAASGSSTVVLLDSYGTAAGPGLTGRTARGTNASPTATQNQDILVSIGGRGYGTTGFASSASSAIILSAAEAFTDTARGSRITFETTPTGSTTRTLRMTIDPNGNVGIGSSSPSQYLHVQSRTAGDSPTVLVSNDGTGTGNATLLLQRNSVDFGRIRHNPGGGNQTMEFVATHSTTPGYRFYTSLDGTTLTERMRIDSSGNVGIATPGATTLDVNGNVSIRSSNNAQTGSAVTLTAPTTSFVRLTAAVTSVAGITAGANGQTLTLSNRSGGTVAINDEDATATAANRIRTGSGASFNLSNNASIQLAYDSTTSRWMVVGTASSTTSVVSVSIDTVLTSLNDVVLVSASGAARTITLPTPISGKTITVKKTDSSANAVTISRSSTETIDGNNSVTLSAQYDSYTMVSDGTNWFII